MRSEQLKKYLSHSNLFFFGLMLFVVGMPLSRFLVSVSQFVLLGNWLIERDFLNKWNTLKKSKAFWAFTAFYLFCALSVLWSNDFSYATKDLRVKLPMLWLPLLFFTTQPLNKQKYHLLMHFFVLACIIASFCSVAVYFGIGHKKIKDIRDISIFESHIRFSLMLVLSVCYTVFCLFYLPLTKQKVGYLFALAWLLFFIVFLQSVTGLIILIVLAFLGMMFFLFSKQSGILKISLLTVFMLVGSYLFYVIRDEYKKLFLIYPIEVSALPKVTQSGNAYQIDSAFYFIENGNSACILICQEELKKAWNIRSKIPIDSLDAKKNFIRYTLIRYLTSKGFTKDSAGVAHLNKEDITCVEKGYANCLYTKPARLRTRIHELLWETEHSTHNDDANGHSLSMRFEFWKTAFFIIKKHTLWGVGAGDVKQSFNEAYQQQQSSLTEQFRLRSHNQYLSVLVALGVIGLLLFLLHLCAPFITKNKLSVLYLSYLLIVWLSYLNEDTLETQAGVSFCVFFTQLFFHHDAYNT
ncbi:MAG: O-antigen ligase family protein [Bacteroidetes bacterium]|nr:O-antigen ligase family protein [Bacteroidota bacterium]